jgi:predicted Fe-Mo cluster-binding NifX family protein
MKTITLLVILSVSLLATPVFAAENRQTGNIAVASSGKTPTSPVADRMGRSPFYLVFNRGGTFFDVVANPNFGKRQGPGEASAVDSITFDEKGAITGGGFVPPSREERDQTWSGFAEFFVRNGITVVVAEEFGEEIIKGMKTRGIQCVAFKGSAKEAVERIAREALRR